MLLACLFIYSSCIETLASPAMYSLMRWKHFWAKKSPLEHERLWLGYVHWDSCAYNTAWHHNTCFTCVMYCLLCIILLFGSSCVFYDALQSFYIIRCFTVSFQVLCVIQYFQWVSSVEIQIQLCACGTGLSCVVLQSLQCVLLAFSVVCKTTS